MKDKKIIFYHWGIFRYIQAQHIPKDSTISIVNSDNHPLMIFLTQNSSMKYEVTIYKTSTNQEYHPHPTDFVKSYERNDDRDTFTFDNFEYAHEFIDFLRYHHPEYYPRPNGTEQ